MTNSLETAIAQFFASSAFGVVGASNNRQKYGNKVLRVYLQHQKKVYPVNPHEAVIEGLNAVPRIFELPPEVKSISIITPPQITQKIVLEAISHGIKNIWMQPGAENDEAISQCKDQAINVIAGGPCILVTLGFREA